MANPVYAADGEEFQEYSFIDGGRVPAGTLIGYEARNPRTREYEILLFNDIYILGR